MAAPPPIEAAPQIDAAMCERLVTAASQSCSAITVQTPAPPAGLEPNWSALENSFAALSNSFALGSLLFGAIAVLGGLAWGYTIKCWAEREARKEARECAEAYINKWLADVAPEIISTHMEFIGDAVIDGGDDEKGAQSIGENA